MAGAADLDEAVIVALGSNLAGGYASSEALLEAALAGFAQAGLPVVSRSSWWVSTAWPDPLKPEYRNGVVLVEAPLGPEETIRTLFNIEAQFGRRRGAANDSRTLDLDLIAFGRQVRTTPELTLPHPRAHERLFVMGPLAQVAPGWRHPVLGATAAELAARASVGRDAHPA
ncbi:MAG: 2-amino-4-hydroxy-6-hydroxymethyldihydropteridine diphosphokinase [Phenylobacterium sp.]|uniref:2-amino-4-hydroxy-6- hydroxymethyldihydropteridine diphosphokinase n=1 Tax=Phenylobacterium sp. TaxID=1871053 RepID=UPI0039191F95